MQVFLNLILQNKPVDLLDGQMSDVFQCLFLNDVHGQTPHALIYHQFVLLRTCTDHIDTLHFGISLMDLTYCYV